MKTKRVSVGVYRVMDQNFQEIATITKSDNTEWTIKMDDGRQATSQSPNKIDAVLTVRNLL